MAVKIERTLFCLYLFFLAWIIVLKGGFSLILPAYHYSMMELIPFHPVSYYMTYAGIRQAFLNVMVFVPYGFLYSFFVKDRPYLQRFIPIICTSFVFELLQYLLRIGIFDMTDLLMNGLGGLIGMLFFDWVMHIYQKENIF